MITHLRICGTLLVFLLLLLSCSEDSDTIIEIDDNVPEVEEKIFATFNGLILNEEDEKIKDAVVMIGEESSQSDENGFFTITGFFNSAGTQIMVTKEGYFTANGRLIPYADASVNTKIKLIRKNNPINEESNEIITYETNLSRITFKENSYVLSNSKYNGTVEIAGTSIDLQDPDYSLYAPGTMETFKNNQLKLLLPFGRVNVELFSDTGEPLDIDAPAEIKFDIADNLVQTAPDEIPMWYLDTKSGLWIEDGNAIKSGDQYIGAVNHFTEWCVAEDYEVYRISGKITQNGEPYPNANMGVTFLTHRSKYKSAEDGSYTIPVYTSQNVLLDISDQCNTPIYENTISDISMDITEDINLTRSPNSFDVSGNIFCMDVDATIEDSYVLINFDNSQFSDVVATDETGRFSFFYEDCNNQDVSLIAYDPANSNKSSVVFLSGNSVDLAMDVCEEEIAGSIRIEIDGEDPYIIPGCSVNKSEYDGLPGFQYVFRSRDNFSSLPDVSGAYVDYEVIVNISAPGGIELPVGPDFSPLDLENGLSENAPFYFEISSFGATILSENDETVVIKVNEEFPIRRWQNNTFADLNGRIIFEGIKN